MKEIQWKRKWFNQEKLTWSVEKQKEFLDEIAKKFGVNKPSDWGRVLNRDIQLHGGYSILQNYGSIRKALLHLFPS